CSSTPVAAMTRQPLVSTVAPAGVRADRARARPRRLRAPRASPAAVSVLRTGSTRTFGMQPAPEVVEKLTDGIRSAPERVGASTEVSGSETRSGVPAPSAPDGHDDVRRFTAQRLPAQQRRSPR